MWARDHKIADKLNPATKLTESGLGLCNPDQTLEKPLLRKPATVDTRYPGFQRFGKSVPFKIAPESSAEPEQVQLWLAHNERWEEAHETRLLRSRSAARFLCRERG